MHVHKPAGIYFYYNSRNKLLNSTVYRKNQLWQTLSSEIKDCHHYNFLRAKSKFGTVIDVSVKFTPRYLANIGYF